MTDTDTVAASLLLVDDNPTNLQVLYQTLDGRGYNLRIARSGEDALKIARKLQPDLVLLDIMMPPGIDGYETIRRLKEEAETEPAAVIFMSALGETKDKVRGLDLGAVDYITKPFQAEEVIARVETHLTVQRLRRDLERHNAALAQANAKMKRDLDAAARVQRSLLPGSLPRTDRARFSWEYRPCDELAGDALDVYTIDDRHVGVYVVDVSGHGVPAALLSVAVTRSLVPREDGSSIVRDRDQDTLSIASPAEVARRLNTLFPMERNGNHYLTLLYGVLDTESGCLRYACAGHPGPVIIRADGTTEVRDIPSFPIGIVPDGEYEVAEIRLEPGDRVYFHSDGINEAMNVESEMYGRERIAEAAGRAVGGTLADSVQAIVADVAAWQGGDQFEDDLSLLGIERTRA